MYHFSELFDLNELSRQTQETNYTRRTVRLVSDSISDRTLGDDTTHGIKQGSNIDETMPLSPSDGLLGHEGPRSVSGATIISSQSDASQHSDIRQTSDILLPLDPKNSPATPTPIVSSPSGQLLDFQTYVARPDRPLTIKERQARIEAEVKRKVKSYPRKQERNDEKRRGSRRFLGWATRW